MHNLITRGWYLGDNCTPKNNDDTTDGTNTDGSGNNMTGGNSNDQTDNTDAKDQSNDSSGEGNNGDAPNQQSDNTFGQWVDFCKLPLEDIDLEYTDGVEIKKDLERGIWARGTGAFFGRVVKFPKYQWKRDDELSFSFVFTVRGQNPSFLFGIGSPDVDVNNLGHQALFSGEIQLFYDNGCFNRFFGGSGERNYAQNTNAYIKFGDNKFYKIVFEKSGKVGSNINLYQVNKQDFDFNIVHLGTYTVKDNPADSDFLIPYWNVISSSGVFITAIRVL
ncbi:hypothetical protein [Aquimarina agarilytica]|uniref:hypothetical protein n=1 Tax=Aquimarina agarilytica TaxID=1087449 RepID=UPI00028954FB|nr:hypothetical protein [Aquimarina agarilytica]